jgi:hypothetical protein
MRNGLFRDTAEGETGHAQGHLDLDVGDLGEVLACI